MPNSVWNSAGAQDDVDFSGSLICRIGTPKWSRTGQLLSRARTSVAADFAARDIAATLCMSLCKMQSAIGMYIAAT